MEDHCTQISNLGKQKQRQMKTRNRTDPDKIQNLLKRKLISMYKMFMMATTSAKFTHRFRMNKKYQMHGAVITIFTQGKENSANTSVQMKWLTDLMLYWQLPKQPINLGGCLLFSKWNLETYRWKLLGRWVEQFNNNNSKSLNDKHEKAWRLWQADLCVWGRGVGEK